MKRTVTFGMILTFMIAVLCSCNLGQSGVNGGDYKLALEKSSYSTDTKEINYSVENNSADKTLEVGEECSLEYNKDGEWEEIELSVFFYGSGLIIPPSESRSFSLDLSKVSLEKGKYRIVKDARISQDATPEGEDTLEQDEEIELTAEFTVE